MEAKQTLILNSPDACVEEMLRGLCVAHPALCTLPGSAVVVDSRWVAGGGAGRGRRRVAIVTGGGSGHEPFAAGYVGRGMVTSAVAGAIFASPSAAAVERAVRAVASGGAEGVLVVAYNYTGDRIHFGQAVERCRDLDTEVEMVILGDDSALTTLGGTAGRRGLCGGALLLKILGAQAERGSSLAELLVTCRDVTAQLSTCGAAAGGCTVPGASQPLFTVPPGMLELGLGVHGEAGAKTLTKSSAKKVVAAILELMLDSASETSLSLASGDRAVALINNLGSMSHMEILVIANEVSMALEKKGVVLERLYAGPYMTSLDMRGFHITLLRTTCHPHWLQLLDDPTDAPVWLPSSRKPEGLDPKNLVEKLSPSPKKTDSKLALSEKATATVKALLRGVATAAPGWTDQLNQLDSGCGDGDCGSTFSSGAQRLLAELDQLPVSRPVQLLDQLAHLLGESMGGTSGGLYSILFSVMANRLADAHTQRESQGVEVSGDDWLAALMDALAAVQKYGGAKEGDRTMLDALCPAVAAAKNLPNRDHVGTVLSVMAGAADAGACATSGMRARAGRASYVRGGDAGKEDAGARAVALVLCSLSGSCHSG